MNVVKILADEHNLPQYPSELDAMNMNIETIAALGGYKDEDAVISDAVREFLQQRLELRLSVSVEKYRSEDTSLNRAAELAGVSAEEFKDALAEREIDRDGGFLNQQEREQVQR